LQVEHGISELCFQVDLVEMMLRQADEELKGNLGLSDAQLEQYQRFNPTGHAIELRIYAENPAKAFRPAPGLLQHVQFPTGDKIRVDTWVETGTEVSSSFDPLLAKLMVHDQDRSSAIATIYMALSKTILKGPPTNTSYLAKILQCPDFLSGFTTTNMLATRFTYQPAAIEFVEPGAYTSVQDWPGRRNIPNGVPRSGPMDDFSFRVANLLVGNDEGTAGFEITLFGPTIIFHSAATIALCGAEFEFKVNGQQAPTWTRFDVEAGSEVAIGEPKAGARGYLAIKGGLPNVAEYLGSKSTTPSVNWGGHQGRCIRAGDFLFLDDSVNAHEAIRPPLRLPKEFRPVLENAPEVYALPGPFFDSEYLADGSEFLQNSTYTVSFQSSRNSIRLDGPPPLWSRSNGGEGGSHPSNMVGYGSTVGGVSFTGDLGLTFMLDAGNTTGFITTHTVPEVDLRRLAQLKPGEKVRYRAISWKQARELAERLESHLQKINAWVKSKNLDATITTLDWGLPHEAVGNGVLLRRDETGDLPTLTVRQSGDHAVLCILGDGTFTVPIRARLQQLSDLIRNHPPYGFLKHCSTENASILIFFDPHLVTQTSVLNTISSIEASITQTLQAKIPSRIIHLPAIFDAEECHQTIQRYMTLQRPYAAYLPDNVDFIRRSNGLLSKDQLKKSFFEVPLLVNMVGNLMGLPLYIPIDPRLRLNVPKYNPSRTYTKAGSLGIGGNTCSIYPHDSPGGYMLFGMTLPGCCWDTYGRKIGFKPEKPWLFEEFDQIIFHEVGREEYDDAVRRFEAGTYEIQIEKVEFDMLAYNELVRNTTHEVRQIKLVQEICTRKENEREAELYEKWGMEKAEAVANAKPRNPGPLRESKLCRR
jgi:urea carboxylase